MPKQNQPQPPPPEPHRHVRSQRLHALNISGKCRGAAHARHTPPKPAIAVREKSCTGIVSPSQCEECEGRRRRVGSRRSRDDHARDILMRMWAWLRHQGHVPRQRLCLRPVWIRVWGGTRARRTTVNLLRLVRALEFLGASELEVERMRAEVAPGVEMGVSRQRPCPRPHGTEGATGSIYRVNRPRCMRVSITASQIDEYVASNAPSESYECGRRRHRALSVEARLAFFCTRLRTNNNVRMTHKRNANAPNVIPKIMSLRSRWGPKGSWDVGVGPGRREGSEESDVSLAAPVTSDAVPKGDAEIKEKDGCSGKPAPFPFVGVESSGFLVFTYTSTAVDIENEVGMVYGIALEF